MMRKLRSRWAVRHLLGLLLFALPAAGSAQLNPTVKVLPRATAPVPPECDQGLAPQPAPRITQEEKTVLRDTSADMQAPPSATLRSELRSALEAVQRGYRDRLRDSLARAKTLLTSYPPGAERSAAADVISVLDDIDKIWEFQFSSPTGAFFDAGSDIFRIASKYPGYDAFIRRQVIIDNNGNRFYPTHETRDFLSGETAERLARMTGQPAPKRPAPPREIITETPRRTPPPPPPTTRRETMPKRPTTTTTTAHETTKRPPAAKHATRPATTHRKAHKPVTREARVSPPPEPRATRRTETTEKPAAATTHAPATTTREVAPVAAPTTTSAPPPPPPPPPAATNTVTAAATATTATSTSATNTATDTATTEPATTTAETATQSTAAQPQPQSRSFVIPLLLILVGLGVLVLLFRASS